MTDRSGPEGRAGDDSFEAHLRKALRETADQIDAAPGLPAGTRKRVKARRALNAAGAAGAVALVALGAVAGTRAIAPSPTIDIADTGTSNDGSEGESPARILGGSDSRSVRDVLASGKVSGERWELGSFERNGDSCAQINVGSSLRADCDETVPRPHDLTVASIAPPRVAERVVFGKVSERVETVAVTVFGAGKVKAELEAARDLEVKMYVAFVRDGADGEVVASAGGRVLERRALTEPERLTVLDCDGRPVGDPALACDDARVEEGG